MTEEKQTITETAAHEHTYIHSSFFDNLRSLATGAEYRINGKTRAEWEDEHHVTEHMAALKGAGWTGFLQYRADTLSLTEVASSLGIEAKGGYTSSTLLSHRLRRHGLGTIKFSSSKTEPPRLRKHHVDALLSMSKCDFLGHDFKGNRFFDDWRKCPRCGNWIRKVIVEEQRADPPPVPETTETNTQISRSVTKDPLIVTDSKRDAYMHESTRVDPIAASK